MLIDGLFKGLLKIKLIVPFFCIFLSISLKSFTTGLDIANLTLFVSLFKWNESVRNPISSSSELNIRSLFFSLSAYIL